MESESPVTYESRSVWLGTGQPDEAPEQRNGQSTRHCSAPPNY